MNIRSKSPVTVRFKKIMKKILYLCEQQGGEGAEIPAWVAYLSKQHVVEGVEEEAGQLVTGYLSEQHVVEGVEEEAGQLVPG